MKTGNLEIIFLWGRGEERVQAREKNYPTEAWVTLCDGVGDSQWAHGPEAVCVGAGEAGCDGDAGSPSNMSSPPFPGTEFQ